MKPARDWRSILLLAALLVMFIGVIAWASVTINDQASAAKVPPAKAASAANGAKQAATHKAAVSRPPIVPFIHTLTLNMPGCQCATVFQMQRALKAAGYRKGKSTGYYARATAHQVAAFQRAHKIKPASGRYGLRTHRALSKFYDKPGRARLLVVAKGRRIAALTAALATVAFHTQTVGGTTLRYSQSASRGILPKYPLIPPATDCSGMVTYWFKSVGLPDPNGFAYSPVGWTGTLGKHGVVVPASQARIGDLALYGGGYPFGHVAMVVRLHPTMVMSHGGPGVKLLPISYRPLSQVRRYF